jgi:hypothetical protein
LEFLSTEASLWLSFEDGWCLVLSFHMREHSLLAQPGVSVLALVEG